MTERIGHPTTGEVPMARRRPESPRVGEHLAFGEALGLLAVFSLAAFVIYGPALDGPFVSDDLHYVATNPYIHALTLENVRQILDPWSAASIFVVNYTPVHLLLHAVQWSLFGPEVLGFHVTNVALHAVGSVLLVGVFRASGIHRFGAILGGALFLCHPANVEAVAWISQLKTSSCFVLSMAALLAFPAAPALATPFFFLALLAKPTAAFLLPVVGVLIWVRLSHEALPRRHLLWFGVWVIGFLILAVAQIEVNRRSGTPDSILTAEGFVRLRTVFAIALRYVVMSASSIGVSAFHEPEPEVSALGPWFLASLPVLALIAARAIWTLVKRREEAVYWVWAAASFAPVSQVFPFLYPMADRYLYFILPGFLGASLLVLQSLVSAPARDGLASHVGPSFRRLAPRIGLVLGVVLCLVFAVRSHARARIWHTPALLVADAARNYPSGVAANLINAKRAAQEGDVARAVAALRAAQARGFNRFEQLDDDPGFEPIRNDPRFRALVRDLASWWIERTKKLESPTQIELHVCARAHMARGETADALQALEDALKREGPLTEQIRGEIEELQRGS
jgi:hypothetical protein